MKERLCLMAKDPRDLDVDLDKVLVIDDASRYMDTLTWREREARYCPERLIDGPTGLTDEQRRAIESLFGPDRPGFEEAMKYVLPKAL